MGGQATEILKNLSRVVLEAGWPMANQFVRLVVVSTFVLIIFSAEKGVNVATIEALDAAAR